MKPSKLFKWPRDPEDMKHYEEIFDLYELGRIHRLRSIRAEDKKFDRVYDIFHCSMVLAKFIQAPANQELLPGSVAAARRIHDRTRRLMSDAIDSNKGQEEIGLTDVNALSNDLTGFDALLNHELGKLPAYIIEKRIGIYNLDDLANKADLHLSVSVETQVANDLKAAGRCLAFGVLTASGFHSVRAVEGAARAYYKLLTGEDPTEAGMPLGPIINGLRKQLEKEGNDSDTPLGLVISTLARINNMYRKPLTHPEMVLDSPEAAKLVFELAGVAITQIVEDHRTREQNVPVTQLSFDQIGSTPVATQE